MMSKYLPKQDFGHFNWAVALGFTVISFASLGLDLVFVKRVAGGEDVLTVSGIHFFHTLIVGGVVCAAAISAHLAMPELAVTRPGLLFILFNISLINIANSFKLGLNGLEAYRDLAFLALWTNLLKLGVCVSLFFMNQFSLVHVIGAFVASSILELFCSYYYLNRAVKNRVKPLLRLTEYKYFILESLPQLGVVIFDSALSRLDIILLGVMGTVAATADYSFAYKLYELSKIPIIIIGPVLLTRFSKLFATTQDIDLRQKNEIRFFFQFELFLIMFIPLLLIALWSPLMAFFTDGKYGVSNENMYILLAPCVPLVCIVNFLWTIGFVQGQLKTIMYITMAVTLVNIAFNAVLIPIYGGIGSAISFLASSFLQVGLYLIFIRGRRQFLWLRPCIFILLCAVVSALAGNLSTNNPIFAAIISTGVYMALVVLTRQINFSQALTMLRNKHKNG